MLMYSMNIIWSDEDEAFLATIPEFPGLSAFGETQEEAMQEALEAARGMVAVYEEDVEKIPEPRKKREYSGQTRLRLPKSLHENLAREAEAEGTSLNSYIVFLLTQNYTVEHIQKIQKRERRQLQKVIQQTESITINYAYDPDEKADAIHFTYNGQQHSIIQ